MPYGAIKDPAGIAKMESCIEQVMADGKPKSAAIAICYSSITGKKVIVSPYPIADKPVGDLVHPGRTEKLTWIDVAELAERDDQWAVKMLSRRETISSSPTGRSKNTISTTSAEKMIKAKY